MKDVIEKMAFVDGTMTREELAQQLTKECRTAVVFMSEVLSSPACMDALAEVYWKRYVALNEKKALTPELPLGGVGPLNGNGHVH